MRKLLLVPLAAALVFAVPASAATKVVGIKATTFSPGDVTINFRDSVRWKNVDKVDHQVVANDGSFASPVIAPGRSWTHQFTTAGTFKYHDAFKPALKATLRVKGPPPAVTLAVTPPIMVFGTPATLSGSISTAAAGQQVTLTAQEWGQASPVVLATVITGTNGTFGYTVKPAQYTTYGATWKSVSSAPVIAQVAPVVTLKPRSDGRLKAQVSGGRSFWHRHVFLQRLSSFGQWVNVGALKLGPHSGKVFSPGAFLPHGVSRVRVFLTVNQAGNGLLSAHSGMQLVRRR